MREGFRFIHLVFPVGRFSEYSFFLTVLFGMRWRTLLAYPLRTSRRAKVNHVDTGGRYAIPDIHMRQTMEKLQRVARRIGSAERGVSRKAAKDAKTGRALGLRSSCWSAAERPFTDERECKVDSISSFFTLSSVSTQESISPPETHPSFGPPRRPFRLKKVTLHSSHPPRKVTLIRHTCPPALRKVLVL